MIDRLLPFLGGQDDYLGLIAGRSIAQIVTGERAGLVIDKLLPLLDDRDQGVRRVAAKTLVKFRPESAEGARLRSCSPPGRQRQRGAGRCGRRPW